MKRIGALRPNAKLLALETGRKWPDWPKTTQSGSGSWTVEPLPQMLRDVLSWRNGSAGAGKGLASFRIGLTFPASGSYTGVHTVHVRCDRSDDAAELQQVGPATAIHQSTPGVAYAVRIVAGGTLQLAKLSSWSVTSLGTVARRVAAGDVVSLSYRIASGTAELAVMHNGIVVLSATDATGLSMGRPGLLGDDSFAVPTTKLIGHTTTEWWVTGGWQSYEEPQARPQLLSGLRVAVLGRRPWLNSPTPVIRRLVSGEMLSAKWAWKRIGGCTTLEATFRYPDTSSGEHDDAKTWSDPDVDDWETGHWLGGEVTLELHHLDVELSSNQKVDTIWRGRVSHVDADPHTRTITMEAEGLVAVLDELQFSRTYDNWTLREVMRDLAILASQIADPGFGGGSSYIRYNPSKIIGIQSALDQRATFDFDHVSIHSAIQQVVALLPDGFVWGVDVDGDFYVDQQVDHYATDLQGGVMQHFDTATQAVQDFSLAQDFSKITTNYLVLGKELPGHQLGPVARNSRIRIDGHATSTRARAIFGWRSRTEVDGDLLTSGMCAKVAAAALRKMLLPTLSGRLTVVDGAQDARAIQHLIDRAPPRVSVADRQRAVLLPGGGPNGRVTTEYTLRRWGDVPSFRTNDKGSAGAWVILTSAAAERTANLRWLHHVTLRFDYAIVSGSNNVLIGGRDAPGDGGYGWGCVLWQRSTGKLLWAYTNSSLVSRTLDTGITVNTATPGGAVVHLSVWRDGAGTFRFYNGNALTATITTWQSDTLQDNTAGWRWFTQSGALALDAWDGAFEQVWFVLTHNEEVDNSGGVPAFISASNDKSLARHRSHGLLLYLPANEPVTNPGVGIPVSSTRHLPAWQGGVVVNAIWNLSLAGGTGDGAAATAGVRRGVMVGHAKRWGGPIVLDVETCEYSLDVNSGQLVRTFTLGNVPSNAMATLARLREDVRRLNEAQTAIRDARSAAGNPNNLERLNGTSGSTSGRVGNDHGDMAGLGDDDHAQYHNDTRGDLRYARRANNLSDLDSAATARSNLGLGSAATKNTGTGADNLPLMSSHVDAEDFANAGLPVKMTAGGAIPTHTHTGTQVAAATTTTRGTVELATDLENAADVVVQGNDTRLNKACRTLAQTLDSAAVSNTAAEQTLCDMTVAANTLGANGAVELVAQGYIKNNTGSNLSITFRVYWGGTVYWGDVYGSHPSDNLTQPWEIHVRVQNLGATNKQSVRGWITVHTSSAGSVAGIGNLGINIVANAFSHSGANPAQDTTAAKNVKLTLQLGTASTNAEMKLDVAQLVLFPGA